MIPISLFLAFAFGYFLTHLFRVVNAVVGPAISSEVGIDIAGLGFLTSAYFLAFAATQLPLGILLDRFPANRVQAVFLVATAVGAVVFAVADSVTMLTVGRALIGLGVSSGLMSAFKAYSTVLPPQRLPLVNSLHMAAGSLGVLTGGLPVELARTMVVNALVVMEIAYLFSIRYTRATSLTWRGVLGTRAVLIGVGVVVVAQLAFTYAPPLQALFESRPVALADGLAIVGIGALLLALVELEKRLAGRLGYAG